MHWNTSGNTMCNLLIVSALFKSTRENNTLFCVRVKWKQFSTNVPNIISPCGLRYSWLSILMGWTLLNWVKSSSILFPRYPDIQLQIKGILMWMPYFVWYVNWLISQWNSNSTWIKLSAKVHCYTEYDPRNVSWSWQNVIGIMKLAYWVMSWRSYKRSSSKGLGGKYNQKKGKINVNF